MTYVQHFNQTLKRSANSHVIFLSLFLNCPNINGINYMHNITGMSEILLYISYLFIYLFFSGGWGWSQPNICTGKNKVDQ